MCGIFGILSKTNYKISQDFINQALNNEPLTIYGSGDQTRSFCYIEDLIKGMISLMENYQNSDGSITIPDPLKKYMDNKEKI